MFLLFVFLPLSSGLWYYCSLPDSRVLSLCVCCLHLLLSGYISRSVAGSYDNEGVAIFALIITFYFWVKSVKTGSMFWAALTSLGYFYMVSAWGGYIFIINIIPIHVLVLLITGRYSHRLYVAYSTLYVLGTVLSMQVTFVGFQPVRSAEHMAGASLLLCVICSSHCGRDFMCSEQLQ